MEYRQKFIKAGKIDKLCGSENLSKFENYTEWLNYVLKILKSANISSLEV